MTQESDNYYDIGIVYTIDNLEECMNALYDKERNNLIKKSFFVAQGFFIDDIKIEKGDTIYINYENEIVKVKSSITNNFKEKEPKESLPDLSKFI